MHHYVLFVDDEPCILSAFRRAFHGEPFEVICANSAQEALIFLQAKPIDVVVSDQDMPGISGTAFLAQVRRFYPDTIRFMLTGKATLEIAIAAINEGESCRFFTKPCNPVDLAVTIQQALQHRELMLAAKQLLQTVRQTSTELEQLEHQYPGITNVRTDADGIILAQPDPLSLSRRTHRTAATGAVRREGKQMVSDSR